MVSQRGKLFLHKIAIAVAAVIIMFVGLWAIGSALQKGEESRQRLMDNRANFVAKCKSVGGEIGGDKCYVKGVEVFSE